MVIDKYDVNTASRVASGIINPVTGRRVVRTWMIDELLPFAQHAYAAIGEDLGIKAAREMDMLTFHTTEQMSSAWYERMAEGEDYLQHVSNTGNYEPYFAIQNGIGITRPCVLVNLEQILEHWRQYLIANKIIENSFFDIDNCEITHDGVAYNGIHATKLIICSGIDGFNNKYFGKLPFALSKGEVIIAEIPGLPATNIYKQGINIVPLEDGKFWIGSSFEWEFADTAPTNSFMARVTDTLDKWLHLPYKIVEHKASVRPASLERRPFVGLHPLYPAVGILNGMGTKGCSLAPYFSYQFSRHLIYGEDIHPSADINRFSKLLSV